MFFISVLFVVLCSLCLYVVLLLLFTWLLTDHVYKQELNWTELLCVLHLWQVLTLFSTVLYKYIKAHYLYISLFIYLLNILDFVGIHLWLIIKEFQMDMHDFVCYTFKSNFVTATNSKLILRENPYYFWRTCWRTCFCHAIIAVMFIVFALLTATSEGRPLPLLKFAECLVTDYCVRLRPCWGRGLAEVR